MGGSAVIINFFNSRRFESFLGESPLNCDMCRSPFTVHGGYRLFCVLLRYSSNLFASASIFSRTASIGR